MREILEIQSLCYVILLASHGAVDDEVEGAVDYETEVTDGCQGEHPAWMNWQQTFLHTYVSPFDHIGLNFQDGI